ncbi:MAG: hypothetical protein H6894_00830 [Defluviimonas sp.]|nr:hypothetical protein [Defluviimonas sp.]
MHNLDPRAEAKKRLGLPLAQFQKVPGRLAGDRVAVLLQDLMIGGIVRSKLKPLVNGRMPFGPDELRKRQRGDDRNSVPGLVVHAFQPSEHFPVDDDIDRIRRGRQESWKPMLPAKGVTLMDRQVL